MAENGGRAGGKEDHGAGTAGLKLAVRGGRDGARFDDDDFFLQGLRRFAAFRAGLERGEVAVHLVGGGGRAVADVAGRARGGAA